MKKDKYKTDVIFRMDTKKDDRHEVIAVFPHDVSTPDGMVGIYVHIGQHGSGDYNVMLQRTRLATKKEYADLKRELEHQVGYNLNVIKKRNYDKYLKSYYEARK